MPQLHPQNQLLYREASTNQSSVPEQEVVPANQVAQNVALPLHLNVSRGVNANRNGNLHEERPVVDHRKRGNVPKVEHLRNHENAGDHVVENVRLNVERNGNDREKERRNVSGNERRYDWNVRRKRNGREKSGNENGNGNERNARKKELKKRNDHGRIRIDLMMRELHIRRSIKKRRNGSTSKCAVEFRKAWKACFFTTKVFCRDVSRSRSRDRESKSADVKIKSQRFDGWNCLTEHFLS